jgi:hypothetical protein
MHSLREVPKAYRTETTTMWRHAEQKEWGLNPNDPAPLLSTQNALGLDVLGHCCREHMSEEHCQDWPDNDRDDVDQLQVLPTVVDDEDAHHGDRGVDDPIDENWPMQAFQPAL